MGNKKLIGWKTLTFLLFASLLLVGLSCARAPAQPVPGAVAPGPAVQPDVTITLTADKFAFDKKTITVPAGASVRIAFANNDGVIRHNFAVYKTSSATASTTASTPGVIFEGEFIDAGNSIHYDFTAPSEPGTYLFRCDAHPRLMSGDFIVEANK